MKCLHFGRLGGNFEPTVSLGKIKPVRDVVIDIVEAMNVLLNLVIMRAADTIYIGYIEENIHWIGNPVASRSLQLSRMQRTVETEKTSSNGNHENDLRYPHI